MENIIKVVNSFYIKAYQKLFSINYLSSQLFDVLPKATNVHHCTKCVHQCTKLDETYRGNFEIFEIKFCAVQKLKCSKCIRMLRLLDLTVIYLLDKQIATIFKIPSQIFLNLSASTQNFKCSRFLVDLAIIHYFNCVSFIFIIR